MSTMLPTLMLHDFITANHEAIVRRARKKAASRSSLRPTDSDLDKGILLFLDQLTTTLRRSTSEPELATGHATEHGGHLYRMGFSIAQVVHGYGDVCQTVTELALELDASIAVDDFRLFNRCLDESIADAVTEYGRQRGETISKEGTERIAVLAHELRNSLQNAMLAFSVLKRGSVGTDSSTASLLNRSLIRIRDTLERSLAEVRLESGAPEKVRISISKLLEENEVASTLEAIDRAMTFKVNSAPDLEVEADPLLLSAALTNLLKNAFKFSRAGGGVLLTSRTAGGRVLLDIEDECGGLAPGKSEELFRIFKQRDVDRSGAGVGLSVARTSIRAMNGEIRVRDLPGKGCVFTIDLPRLASELTLS